MLFVVKTNYLNKKMYGLYMQLLLNEHLISLLTKIHYSSQKIGLTVRLLLLTRFLSLFQKEFTIFWNTNVCSLISTETNFVINES